MTDDAIPPAIPSFDLREIVDDSGIAETMSTFSRLRFQHARLLESLASGHGITSTDIRALFFLAANGDVTPKRVGSFLGLTTGALTSLADRNEKLGFLARTANPDDRRSLLLHLTDEGRAVVDEVGTVYETSFAGAIPAEHVALIAATFASMADALERLADRNPA